ncbi:MAG: ABC transporter substrate-binding protein [Actinobacteria bacterium]|nr:ABC transporter substrate-binding protein [Actinomycetota bacterium]
MTGRQIRNRFLPALALLALGTLIAIGCAQTAPAPAPTTAAKPAAPAATSAPQAPAAQPAATAAPAAAPAAATPKEIKIGVLLPLSGGSASTGLDLKYANELAAEIVNGKYDLNMPLAKTEGLPNLGGAKVSLVFADHQGTPEKGQSEAERLATQEKVTALFGAYQSTVTQTASQAAEKLGIPFVNAESSSPGLTDRGLKLFFRTGPTDATFGKNLFDMLDDIQKQKNIKLKTIGIVNENTLYGTDANKLTKQFAQERGYQVVADIAYPANTSEVTSEVQRVKAANPDVLFQVSYTSDAILFMKTYKQLDVNPQGILAYGAGFVDPEFRKVLGKDSEDVITRAAWSPDIAEKKPVAKAIADMFKAKYGQEMTENSARDFTGMITLLDAINRAKSTDPKAIQAALVSTDIPGDQLIMSWPGVKFDEKGQNMYAQGINMQVIGRNYYTVWPFSAASKEIVWPRPKWADIK